jgi:hypothetical protein
MDSVDDVVKPNFGILVIMIGLVPSWVKSDAWSRP